MANGQEVSEAFCDQLRKPQAVFQPCNIRSCPPRWLTGMWSECSVSCGEGFHSGQVTRKHTRSNGTVQALPPRVCVPRCPGRCLGRIVRMQQQHVICQQAKSSESSCDGTKRYWSHPRDYDVWKWHHPSRTPPLIMHSSYSIMISYGAILSGVCYAVAVPSLRHVRLFATPWTAACNL
ncbi:hypothetical protein FD755_006178 [Muntiacus reevesi]|uniref:Uncharacterized protein n=1 Tax=Muntiacus reevesi TaxID=9886 RepID=A0A5J5MUS0_MUNRE|nr:hypothetical protein FD755_006178 [Muntiacus reevesi]